VVYVTVAPHPTKALGPPPPPPPPPPPSHCRSSLTDRESSSFDCERYLAAKRVLACHSLLYHQHTTSPELFTTDKEYSSVIVRWPTVICCQLYRNAQVLLTDTHPNRTRITTAYARTRTTTAHARTRITTAYARTLTVHIPYAHTHYHRYARTRITTAYARTLTVHVPCAHTHYHRICTLTRLRPIETPWRE
jgi:hypothetical protein